LKVCWWYLRQWEGNNYEHKIEILFNFFVCQLLLLWKLACLGLFCTCYLLINYIICCIQDNAPTRKNKTSTRELHINYRDTYQLEFGHFRMLTTTPKRILLLFCVLTISSRTFMHNDLFDLSIFLFKVQA